jgi:hypothetical protein
LRIVSPKVFDRLIAITPAFRMPSV